MNGNLSPLYQLRVDRLDRLRDRFRRSEIHQAEFRDLLGAEGIVSEAAQTTEIVQSMPGTRV